MISAIIFFIITIITVIAFPDVFGIQIPVPSKTQQLAQIGELMEVKPQPIPKPVVKPGTVEVKPQLIPKPVKKPEKEKQVIPEKSKSELSPYFGRVKISSVRTQTSSRSSLITFSTYLQKEEEINITGWKIRGKAGSFVIPGGIEKYNPYYNPVPEENIFIKQGDTIYLSGASNPLGRGRNFRPNKCLGYLSNYYDFPVSFSRNCPKPTDEEISELKPCCKIFIRNLGRCEAPDYSNNLTVSTDGECTAYLNKNFNYAGCYRNYSRDEDFLENNWHIYMNTNLLITNDCDTVYLRDQNGLFIDKYDYGYPVCK